MYKKAQVLNYSSTCAKFWIDIFELKFVFHVVLTQLQMYYQYIKYMCVAFYFSGDMENKDEEGTCSIYPVCCYSTWTSLWKPQRLWWVSSVNDSVVWNNKCTTNILQCSASVLSRIWRLRQWLRCGHICSWEVTFLTAHCCHIHKIPCINDCSFLQGLDFHELSKHQFSCSYRFPTGQRKYISRFTHTLFPSTLLEFS